MKLPLKSISKGMNKNLPLFFLFFSVILQCSAQSEARPSDTTLLRELKITEYSKDTSAGAVLLLDYGKVSIENDGYSRPYVRLYTITQRIKILNESGLNRSKLNLVLFQNYDEKLINIDAVTYNLEGNKIIASQLKNKEIYDDKMSKEILVKKIAMPDAKPGSVIYLHYTIQSTNIQSFNWYFQGANPVENSKFEVSIPPVYAYETIYQGLDSNCQLTKGEDYAVDNYGPNGYLYHNALISYSLKNIPAFKDETFITTAQDYIVKIGFQLNKYRSRDLKQEKTFLSTWPELNKALLDNSRFGGYLNSDQGDLHVILAQLKLDGKSEMEKAKILVNYVKTNYKWNNLYDVLSQKSLTDFMKEKTGNSANLNLLLISLFNAAKMNAQPVLLSTRNHGKIKANYPLISYFNNVICFLSTDSISLLLDATRPQLPFYCIPPDYINGSGLVVRKDSTEWVVIKSSVVSKVQNIMTLKFTPACDSLNGSLTMTTTGYEAFKLRQFWNTGYEDFYSLVIQGKKGTFDSVKVINEDAPEKPFIVNYSVSVPMNDRKVDTSVNGDSSQISFPPFLQEVASINPLKMPERKYPVDFNYDVSYEYRSFISVPDGYLVYQKPADTYYFMRDNSATFFFKASQSNEKSLQVISSISFNSLYQPDDYKELQKFFDVVIKKYKENVILRKKT